MRLGLTRSAGGLWVRKPAPPNDGGGSFAFQSDWGTATGTSIAAIEDGGIWNHSLSVVGNTGPEAEVVAGAGVGWTRTSNVLRVQNNGSGANLGIGAENLVPASTSFFLRYWIRNDDTGANLNHPVWWGPAAGDLEMICGHTFHGASKYGVSVWLDNVPGVGSARAYVCAAAPPGSANLTNGTWYRYEILLDFITSTRVQPWPRIYDTSGSLLWDSDDFISYGYENQTLTNVNNAGGYIQLTDAEKARDFWMGTEGGTGTVDTGEYWYYAEVRCWLTSVGSWGYGL